MFRHFPAQAREYYNKAYANMNLIQKSIQCFIFFSSQKYVTNLHKNSIFWDHSIYIMTRVSP